MPGAGAQDVDIAGDKCLIAAHGAVAVFAAHAQDDFQEVVIVLGVFAIVTPARDEDLGLVGVEVLVPLQVRPSFVVGGRHGMGMIHVSC